MRRTIFSAMVRALIGARTLVRSNMQSRITPANWGRAVIIGLLRTKAKVRPQLGAYLAVAVLSAFTAAGAAQNPFVPAARESYTGRFHGQAVELRLFPEGDHWQGTLLFQGTSYSVAGDLKPTGLEGTFNHDRDSWPFTVIADGNKLTFTAGSFSAVLERRLLPELSGRWRSHQVLVIFDPPAGKTRTGSIQFQGRQFPFKAHDLAGDLEGSFQLDTESFRFRIANEERGLTFHSSTFSELLTPVPTTARVRVETLPPVSFALLNGSRSVEARDGWFEFAAGQRLDLEVLSDGFEPARNTLTLAPYSEQTWRVVLEPIRYPRAGVFRWTNSLGMIFVAIPRTPVLFCIWDTRVRDYAAYASAVGGVDGTWEHSTFQGRAASESAAHPVTMVTWSAARDFCRWLTQTERNAKRLTQEQEYRLPTDAEWSRAVGLEQEPEDWPARNNGRIKGVYPWGTEWPPPPNAGNFADTAAAAYFKQLEVLSGCHDGFATTSPVGFFAPNRFGLYDMSGNVWQWCEDAWDKHQKLHVARGGSWRTAEPASLLSSSRLAIPDGRDSNLGFRCVLVAQ